MRCSTVHAGITEKASSFSLHIHVYVFQLRQYLQQNENVNQHH